MMLKWYGINRSINQLPVIIARKFKLRGSDNEISPTVKTTISALLCFGGGVMMATAFIHILPEIHNAMMSFGLSDTVPLAEVLCCCGFFLIYLVEELVHMISERKSKREMHQSNTNQSGNTHVIYHATFHTARSQTHVLLEQLIPTQKVPVKMRLMWYF